MSKGPSAHLSWKELACRDGTEYPLKWRENRAIRLAEMFEAIRSACGDKQIQVLSGYRTPEYNRKIGGARFSQHIEGRALDLKPPKGYTITEFFKTIRTLAEPLNTIKGIGRYPTFIHVDIRPSDKLVVWYGTRTRN